MITARATFFADMMKKGRADAAFISGRCRNVESHEAIGIPSLGFEKGQDVLESEFRRVAIFS